MAYFKIEEPNKEVKWVKKVNGADGTIEFTNDRNEAYYQDAGFFADSEKGFLEFHFIEAYPELQYMTIDNEFYNRGGGLQGMAFAHVVEEAAPQVGEAWDEAPAPAEAIG